MPNQRTVIGGLTFVEGIFLGNDDPTSFSHTTHSTVHAGDDADHVDVHALGGALDQGLIDGSLVIQFNSGVEDILYAQDKATGMGKFRIDKDAGVIAESVTVDQVLGVTGAATVGGPFTVSGAALFNEASTFKKQVQLDHNLDVDGAVKCANLEVTDGPTVIEGDITATGEIECHELVVASGVKGAAFSHLDPHGVVALETAVTRDPLSGTVQIANLRCSARKVDLDANGLAPDGFPPGLFMTEAYCSEHLRLIDDGQVLFQPAENTFYRFGSHPDGSNIDADGLYFTSGTANDQNTVQIGVSQGAPSIELVGQKNDVAGGLNAGQLPVLMVRPKAGDPMSFAIKATGETFIHDRLIVEGATPHMSPRSRMGTSKRLIHWRFEKPASRSCWWRTQRLGSTVKH